MDWRNFGSRKMRPRHILLNQTNIFFDPIELIENDFEIISI